MADDSVLLPGWPDRLGRRAEHERALLGSAIARFRAVEQIDDAAVARLLGCSTADLARLKLCRRPNPDAPQFLADSERIATAFGIPVLDLLRLLRRAEAADALDAGPAALRSEQLMAAARDHEPPPAVKEPDKDAEADGTGRNDRDPPPGSGEQRNG